MKRTPKQIAASRHNGAQSEGPKTAQGKARSSRGALKHGARAAKHFVLDDEDPREYEALLHGMFDSLQPVNTLEESLVLQIVNAQWRLQRHTGLEAGLLNLAVEGLIEYMEPEQLSPDPRIRISSAFRFRSDDGDFALNLRYQSQANRDFYRALKTLLALRKSPNEPKTGPTPTISTAFEGSSPAAPTPKAQPPAPKPAKAAAQAHPTPRNAPCPCHSGLKFKRCCGKNAPPHLSKGAQAA